MKYELEYISDRLIGMVHNDECRVWVTDHGWKDLEEMWAEAMTMQHLATLNSLTGLRGSDD